MNITKFVRIIVSLLVLAAMSICGASIGGFVGGKLGEWIVEA